MSFHCERPESNQILLLHSNTDLLSRQSGRHPWANKSPMSQHSSNEPPHFSVIITFPMSHLISPEPPHLLWAISSLWYHHIPSAPWHQRQQRVSYDPPHLHMGTGTTTSPVSHHIHHPCATTVLNETTNSNDSPHLQIIHFISKWATKSSMSHTHLINLHLPNEPPYFRKTPTSPMIFLISHDPSHIQWTRIFVCVIVCEKTIKYGRL